MRISDKKTKVAVVGTIVALLVAFAVPAGAVALPALGRLALARSASASDTGNGNANAQAQSTARLARAAALQARIVAVLQRRKARFDAASALLADRIGRVGGIADKVTAAGGDVTQVKSDLDQAQQHLSAAEGLEAQAVADFQAIPQAPNKLAAFIQARGVGRQAGNELRQARVYVLSAVKALRAQVALLKAAAGTSGGAGLGAGSGGAATGGGNAQP